MNRDISEIIEIIKNGGVGVFATDTAYGIGCRIDDEKAIERIFVIKERPESKPLLALVGSVQMAEEYVEIPEGVKNLIAKYWPGGLTIILKCKKEKVLDSVTARTGTLAIRLPANETLVRVIHEVGVPIVAPSANISGGNTPFTLEEVDEKIKNNVDFILSSEYTMGQVSTILDTTVIPWRVLRDGAVKIEENELRGKN